MLRWCVITACLLACVAAEPHHDGTNHHHRAQEAADDQKELIMLEIEPLKSGSPKGKRSPQSSQAIYGTSPGQFVVRTASPQAQVPEIPPEYLGVLQQLVAQQHPLEQAAGPQQGATPAIQQLLVSRNPDPSAVQFTSVPGTQQVPRRRPQDEPGAQLQQIYFNRQFQQQIPVRPRYLRPPPQRTASQATSGLPASVTASPQAHNVHDARLRASLAGENPNLLQQQVLFALPSQAPEAAYQPQQQQPQQQVSYVQQASPATQRAVAPQQPQQQQVVRRPTPPPQPAPEQYLRETSQPQTSNPSIYLPQEAQSDEDLLSQILASNNGRGLFQGPSTPAPAVSSTTAAPSRSSIYVSQTTSGQRGSSSGVTVQEEVSQDGTGEALPVIHLPTPKGQRPLTQSEFQALIDAGFNLRPIEVPVPQEQQLTEYYTQATTPKRQRSYATTAPPTRNQVQETRKAPQQEPRPQSVRYSAPEVIPKRQEVRYTSPEPSRPQQEEEDEVRIQFSKPGGRRGQYSSYRFEATPPQKQEEEVQYVQIPSRRPLTRYPTEEAEEQVRAYQEQEQAQAYRQEQQQAYQREQQQAYQREEEPSQNFQPIVVADLPSTTPQAPVPRRRRPRPTQRVVYRPQADLEDERQERPSQQQFLISYEAVPDTTTYGSRKSRQRSRRPTPPPES